jgi:hypothetical protein
MHQRVGFWALGEDPLANLAGLVSQLGRSEGGRKDKPGR